MALRLYKNPKFLQVLKSIRQVRNGGSYGVDQHLTREQIARQTKAHYDYLPKPKGKWSDLNDKRQRLNNTTLAVGTLVLISALIGTKSMWDEVLWGAPYDKVRKDFPGSKFVD